MSWPRACTVSSRRVHEGLSCWDSAVSSRPSCSSDWRCCGSLGMGPCLHHPAVGVEHAAGPGSWGR